MITHRFKLILIALACVLISACTGQTSPFDLDSTKYGDVIDRDAKSPGTLIQKRAAQVYDLDYTVGVNNRAMAQSTSGAWGWTHREKTLEAALDRALELCRSRNSRNEAEAPCKIVNVNGWWAANIPLSEDNK